LLGCFFLIAFLGAFACFLGCVFFVRFVAVLSFVCFCLVFFFLEGMAAVYHRRFIGGLSATEILCSWPGASRLPRG
jgi:hypothetical protein